MNINCDLGEGTGRDHLIMPYLDSCNIACGGHFGDRQTMLDTIDLAKNYEVKIGAHPSFVDRVNFGRKVVKLSAAELKSQLIHQIALLNELIKSNGLVMSHVKAHGALYNLAAKYTEYAMVLIESVSFFKESWSIYAPPDSILEHKAREKGIEVKIEVFADRAYADDFTLLPREEKNSVIDDVDRIVARVKDMVQTGEIESIHGQRKAVAFDTICVHGDHQNTEMVVKKLNEINI